MDQRDATAIANRIARQFGVAMACVVMLVAVSINAGVPQTYVWVGAGLVGVLCYNLMSLAVLGWVVDRYASAPQVEPQYEPEPVAAPRIASNAHDARTRDWIASVDWSGLAAYVAHPGAALSRDAVEPWVDQRFYSPRDGDTSRPFPQVMVEAGAAVPVTTNGTTRYVWSTDAPAIVGRIARHYSNSPRPTGADNGTVQ